MKKLLVFFWFMLWMLWIVSAQNVQRNLFFEIETTDRLIFSINWNSYLPDQDDSQLYKSVVTIPKIALQQKDVDQKFIFKVKNNDKLYYVTVWMKFDSFEELTNKERIFLYVWNVRPQEKESYTIQEKNWIFLQSSEQITYQIDEKLDITVDIIFPNILWVKKFWPVAWLWLLIFVLSLSYLVWKKQIIKI